MISIVQIFNVCQNTETLHSFLLKYGLVPKEGDYLCRRCSSPMKLCSNDASIDQWYWFCRKLHRKPKAKAVRCNFKVMLKKGTFFSQSKLSFLQILGFVNFWVRNMPLAYIGIELEINKSTVVDWASFCREVVLQSCLQNPQKLGGPGMIVEIDESKFAKGKFDGGHHVEGQWVFGGFERGTGRVFMVAVEKRDSDTLIPLIEKWIEKGTTIYSDCWNAYSCLGDHGYHHLTVNHSITFKDPDTGCHTNAIQSSWRHAKAVTLSNGRKKAHIPGNLARYMFYKQCQLNNACRVEEFLKLAGKLYNPCNLENVNIDAENYSADKEEEEDLDIFLNC